MPPSCSTCSVRNFCLPCGLRNDEARSIDLVVSQRRRIGAGEHVFRAGDRFEALYAVRIGFLMTYVVSRDGRTQVTGFPMAGDVVGTDGIVGGTHTLSAIALEDGQVCVAPFARLEAMMSDDAMLQHQVNRLVSREIVRAQGVIAMLGGRRAEAKVATFLASLSQRLAARGYSPTEFVLRMSRADIGRHLGLELETVSRALSRMDQQGVIRVKRRHVVILEPHALGEMTMEEREPAGAPRVAEETKEAPACPLAIEDALRPGIRLWTLSPHAQADDRAGRIAAGGRYANAS